MFGDFRPISAAFPFQSHWAMNLLATGKVTVVHRVKIRAEDYVHTQGQVWNSINPSLWSCFKVTLKLQLLLTVKMLFPYPDLKFLGSPLQGALLVLKVWSSPIKSGWRLFPSLPTPAQLIKFTLYWPSGCYMSNLSTWNMWGLLLLC